MDHLRQWARHTLLRISFVGMLVVSGVLGFAHGATRVFADGACNYEGADYLNGSQVCQSGAQYRCEYGTWKTLEGPCALQPVRSQRWCEYEGQSYASGAISCQALRPHRCDDGEWFSIGGRCSGPNGAVQSPPEAQGCAYAGAQFQPSSSRCKGGISFVCQLGRWVDMQMPCN